MKAKKFNFIIYIILIVFCLFTLGSIVPAWAEDPPPPEEDPEVNAEASAFQNPAQAQRAVNLAEAYAAKPDPDLEKALLEVKKAEEAKASLELDGASEEDLEQAQKRIDEALEKVDSYMAGNAGVTDDDIKAMREEGMGWGEIAHELGLHPGVLGLGHEKKQKFKKGWGTDFDPGDEISDEDLEAATLRDFNEGKAKGHDKSKSKSDKDKGKSDKDNGKSDNDKPDKDTGKSDKGSKDKSNNGKKK